MDSISKSHRCPNNRGVALLLVMQLTLLLGVIVLAMSFSSASSVLAAKSYCDDLQNDFALDALICTTQEKLAYVLGGQDPVEITSEKKHLQLGPTRITYVLWPESGKLNLKRLLRYQNREQIQETLSRLREQLLLPSLAINQAVLPVGRDKTKSLSGCKTYEDFFDIESRRLRDVYGPAADGRYWAAFTTLWGSGRIDISQASPAVLRAALEGFEWRTIERVLKLDRGSEAADLDALGKELQLSTADLVKLKTRIRFGSEPFYTLRATAYTSKVGKSMFCVFTATSKGVRLMLRRELPALEAPPETAGN